MSSDPGRRALLALWPTLSRGALLLGAAVLLPCCNSTPGDQPTLSEVTVRVSVQDSGAEGSGGAGVAGCQHPAISSDGRYVAFDSVFTNLKATSIPNTFSNIFVKDRLTGTVTAVTNVVGGGEFGPFLDNCTNPAISGNGQVVAFLSKGIYIPSLGGATNVNVWVNHLVTGTFSPGTVAQVTFPNKDCSDLALSDDGRFLAFATAATNILSSAKTAVATYFGNPSGGIQVYVTDLQAADTVPAIQLLSPGMGTPVTGAAGDSSGVSISGNGSVVSFVSTATNLIASPPTSGVYTSAVGPNSVKLVSVGFNPISMSNEAGNGTCFGTATSTTGQFVAFSAAHLNNWGSAVILGVFRYDSKTGLAVVVAPDLFSMSGMILIPDRFGLSGDGQIVVYMKDQLTVLNLQTGGVQTASVNISGVGANLQCFTPAVSGDGQWAAWSTLSFNLVASDTNGSYDIFVRGPLR
jgi:hypothetical protein